MNHKTINFVAKQLREIAVRVVDFKSQNASIFRIHDGIGYGLLNEDARAFNEVVKLS